MKVELVHPSIQQCSRSAWQQLLCGGGRRKLVQTLGTFLTRVEKCVDEISAIPPDQHNDLYVTLSDQKSGTDVAVKFKGDVFEIFVELLIRLSPMDDRIDVRDYQVVTEGDTGVDGYGLTRDGYPTAVQVKCYAWDREIDRKEARLNNFRLSARRRYNVDVTPPARRLLVVTPALELNYRAIDHFKGCMRCISRDASYGCLRGAPDKTVDSYFSLRTIVDNNVLFWDAFREQVGVSNA